MSELRKVLLDSFSGDAFFEGLFNEATKGADSINAVANELLYLHIEGNIKFHRLDFEDDIAAV